MPTPFSGHPYRRAALPKPYRFIGLVRAARRKGCPSIWRRSYLDPSSRACSRPWLHRFPGTPCYAIVLPGRKSDFRDGFGPDCYREGTEIGPPAPAGRRPAGGPISVFPGSSPAKILSGKPISGPEPLSRTIVHPDAPQMSQRSRRCSINLWPNGALGPTPTSQAQKQV